MSGERNPGAGSAASTPETGGSSPPAPERRGISHGAGFSPSEAMDRLRARRAGPPEGTVRRQSAQADTGWDRSSDQRQRRSDQSIPANFRSREPERREPAPAKSVAEAPADLLMDLDGDEPLDPQDPPASQPGVSRDPGPGAPADDDPIVWHTEDGRPVTRSEAQRGYTRHETFTQKTQEAAEVRRRAEAEIGQTAAVREQLVNRLQHFVNVMQADVPKRPDEALRQTDVVAYNEQAAAFLLYDNQLNEARAELARHAQEQQIDNNRLWEARRVEAQAKMIDEVPSLRAVRNDPAKLKRAFDRLKQAGRAVGYTDEELGGILDHRVGKALELVAIGLAARRGHKGGVASARAREGESGVSSPAAASGNGPKLPTTVLKGPGRAGDGGPGPAGRAANVRVSEAESRFAAGGGGMRDAMEVLRTRREAKRANR